MPTEPQQGAQQIGLRGVRIEATPGSGGQLPRAISSLLSTARTMCCPHLCCPQGSSQANPSPVAKLTPCPAHLLPTHLALEAQSPHQAPSGSGGSLGEARTHHDLFVPGDSRKSQGQTDALSSFEELLGCEGEVKSRVWVLIPLGKTGCRM